MQAILPDRHGALEEGFSLCILLLTIDRRQVVEARATSRFSGPNIFSWIVSAFESDSASEYFGFDKVERPEITQD